MLVVCVCVCVCGLVVLVVSSMRFSEHSRWEPLPGWGIRDFPKIGGVPYFGVLIIRILLFGVLY